MLSGRRTVAALTLVALPLIAGCSTPEKGADTLAAGRQKVVDLVNEATRSLPTTAHAQTVAATGTTNCRKNALGFAVGTTGRHVVEAPVLVQVDAGADPKSALDA